MNKKEPFKENSLVRKNSRHEKFHKLFKAVPPEESPINSFSCAFIGDILLQGNLYVSQNFFCFYSKIRGRGRLLEIPMSRVISITREKTALIIPNAIGFQTASKKYVFGTFLSRDSTYKFVISAWKKSQELGKSSLEQNQSSASETDVTFTTLDTPESTMDGSEIPQMFDEKGSNDMHNNNVTNGHISRADMEDSDTGMCFTCGSRDASDTNDTSKDNVTNVKKTPDKILISQSTTVIHEQRNFMKPRFFIGGGKLGIPYFFQCFDCEKMYEAFSQLSLKFQRIPRTNLLLAICIIMTLFLILSAMALTYKILLLQARIDAKEIWTPASKAFWREKMYSSIYDLNSQSHFSVVKQMNDVLKSNLQVLQELSEDLKRLKAWGAEENKC